MPSLFGEPFPIARLRGDSSGDPPDRVREALLLFLFSICFLFLTLISVRIRVTWCLGTLSSPSYPPVALNFITSFQILNSDNDSSSWPSVRMSLLVAVWALVNFPVSNCWSGVPRPLERSAPSVRLPIDMKFDCVVPCESGSIWAAWPDLNLPCGKSYGPDLSKRLPRIILTG